MNLRAWTRVLWGFALALNAVALYMVFFYAPVEVQMGAAQKIFYYHVPSASSAYVLLFLAFLFSILYLWKEDSAYDLLAYATAEVGFVFMTVVLVTGPIWGRSAWGKWWVWEPRLTTALILWLMYSAYFLLRLFTRHDARAARVAAVVAIVAFFDVPIVHKAIEWWGSVVHPKKVVLEAAMRQTFFVSMAAVFVLAAAMTLSRLAVGKAEGRRLRSREVVP
jgi:heme exporter protein C